MFGKHVVDRGWVYGPPCADFASKPKLKRGRTMRRILRWLKNRSSRKGSLRTADFSQSLPRGVHVEIDRDTGYAYVTPTPNRPHYRDLGAARGLVYAVLLSIPLWIGIAYGAQFAFRLIFG